MKLVDDKIGRNYSKVTNGMTSRPNGALSSICTACDNDYEEDKFGAVEYLSGVQLHQAGK